MLDLGTSIVYLYLSFFNRFLNLNSTAMKKLTLFVLLVLISTSGNLIFAQRTNDLVKWGTNGSGFLDGDVQSVFSNNLITIALKEDGSLVGWGGYYGFNKIPDELNNAGVKKISIGFEDAIALKEDSSIVVWGHYEEAGLIQNLPENLSGIVDIAVGNNFALVLKADSTVMGWGSLYFNNHDATKVPQGLSGVKAISAGDWFSVALKGDGTVVAWGDNSDGQCNVPANLENVKQISAGYNHVIALKEDGTVVQWGGTYSGAPPVGLENVVSISAGYYFTLALKEDGTVVTWGSSNNLPDNLNNVKSITAGDRTGYAVKEDGTVVAWGNNIFGQTDPPIAVTEVKQVALNYGYLFVLKKDGSLVVSGSDVTGGIDIPQDLNHVKSISSKSYYLAVLNENGTVNIYGDERGFVGVADVPEDLASVKAISAGDYHMLALKEDGTVVAWGAGYDNGYISVPIGLTNVKAIAAGGSQNSLALKMDGTLVAWGNDNFWGNKLEELTDVKAISAGDKHFLILKENGTVEVIADATVQEELTPPEGLTNVKAIAAGMTHDLVLKKDGTVVSWGSSWGNSDAYYAVPEGLTKVKAIAVGWTNSVVILEDEEQGAPIFWRDEVVSCTNKSFLQDIRTTVDLPQNSISINFDINYNADVFTPKLKSTGKGATEYAKVLLDTRVPGKLKVLAYLNQAPQGISFVPDELFMTIDWKLTNPEFNTSYEFSMDSIEVSYPIGYEKIKPYKPANFIYENEYLIEIRTRTNILMSYNAGNEELGVLGSVKTLIEGMGSNCSELINSTLPNENAKAVIPAEGVSFIKISRDVYGDQNLANDCTPVNAIINSADVNRVIDIITGKRTVTPLELISADVNLDGAVTLADASLISSRSINEEGYGCEFPQPQNYNVDGAPKENYKPSRDWVFVQKAVSDQYSFDRMNVPLIDECQPTPTGCESLASRFLGILLGDVTGNWNSNYNSMYSGLRKANGTNQLVLDFIHVDTVDDGFLIPVILDAVDHSFGIDITIDLTNLPMVVKKIVAEEGVDTRWSNDNKRILLQSFQYDGLPLGQTVFYIMVESIPKPLSESSLNASINTYINGEISNLRINSNTDSDNTSFEFTLYPNPVADELRIHWGRIINEVVTVQVFDLRGKLIKSFNENVINALWSSYVVSDLQRGSYLLHIVSSEGSVNKTFVKL